MRPNELIQLICDRFKAGTRRPLHIQSSPGVGKTQITEQAAKRLGIGFRMIHAPLLQPEDYGFPVIAADKSNVSFLVSKEKFPVVGSDTPEFGLFTVDELPQSGNSEQKILSTVMYEYQIHGQKIKPGWLINSTGNRTGDRSGANRLLGHLGNRVTLVSLEASLDDWTQWALANAIQSEVIAFLRFRPELLNAFDPQNEVNPTPRSWSDGVSKDLGVVSQGVEFEVFKGSVGEGAAAEFVAFLKIFRKLPSPDAILLNPANAAVPTDPATLYALCGALANRTTIDNFDRVMKYVERMPPEFTVLFVKDAIRRKEELKETRTFIDWASGPGAKLLT